MWEPRFFVVSRILSFCSGEGCLAGVRLTLGLPPPVSAASPEERPKVTDELR